MKRSNIVLSLLGAFGALAAAMAEDGPTRKPEREELWVPSDRLDAVLKEFPKAVMLTPEQYETLVRDAGKLKSALTIDPAIPEGLIIEGLTLTGQAESVSDEVILAGELTVRASREGWSKGSLAWPFVMQSLIVEGGTLLAHLGDVVSAKGSSFRPMELFARGPGVMRLRFTTSLRVFDQWSEGVRTLDIPEVKSSGRLVLTLPTASTVLRSSAHEQSGQVVTAAFDHVAWADEASFVPKDLPRAVRLRWSDALPEADQASVRFLEKGQVSIEIAETGVSVSLTARMVLQAGAGRVVELRWPLREKGTQVTAVTGAAVRDWHQDGQTLVMNIERTGAATDVAIQMRGSGGIDATQSAALELAIPTVVPPVPLSAEAEFELSEDLELLDLRGGRQIDAGHLAFQLGIDAPSVLVRTSKPRIEAVVDALVTLDRDSVMINRTLVLQADRPLSNTRMTLPDGEEFVSINASAGPALKWKRVQQTLELRWQEPIPRNAGASMVLVSRKKLAKAWSGQGIAEPVLVENIRVPEAVKVTGYTALAFDDAWRVRLGTLSGLEDRDVKYSPVTGGRMAWFGLRDWSLNFEAERAGSVYAAVITAYALPRARTVEIEGQVELEISGAPLREFKFKLPPAVAALLRVTSPSVGEQKLDEATGVWTCTLIRESTGRQNIRFRISLPAEISGLEGAATVKTIAAVLPRLEMPEARRFRGTWVVEANTDTQLAFEAKSLQPLDVLRAPTVEGYAPRHRVVGAYTYGTAEHELKLTAERHAHSELAALIVMQLQMNSVLGRDGNALHSALLNLRHSGEQFVTLVLPEGAELLSTVVNGAAVKPVRSQDTAIAIPLPSESANQPNVAVRVQFQLPAAAWTGSGALKVEPVRLPGNVPILSTSWGIDVPEGYTYAKPETRLEASGFDAMGTLGESLKAWLESFTWPLGSLGEYSTAAEGRDHTRSRMLNEAGKAWEDYPSNADQLVASLEVPRSASATLQDKMNRIIFPSVQFSGASVEEAIEFLRMKCRDLDIQESDTAKKGVNFVLKPGAAASDAQISLDLKDVPMSEALRYVTELAGMKYQIEDDAVFISPVGEGTPEMVRRVYRVPPDLLRQLMVGGEASAAPSEPFATGSGAGSGAARRASVMEILKDQGIAFPLGGSVVYFPDSGELIVKNTQENLNLTEAYLQSLSNRTARSSGSEFKAESANRAGLLPLLIDLPEQGRRLFLSGFQEPEVVEIRYVAWETQLFRAMFGIGLGVLLFWGLGRRRWFLATLLVVVLAGFGAPLLAGDGLLAWVNAVLLGWLVGLGLAVLAWILGAAARRAKIRPLQSATAALCLSAIFAPPSTHADEVKTAIADPAAHVVIVPYEPGRLPNGGKGQRYYMPYESFEQLWAAAKESRRPTPLLAEDQQQGAVIHSAYYAAVAEENGLTLHARLEVVSRGRWSPLEIILGGVQKGIGKQEPVALRGLIGEILLDGRSAALHEDKLSLDQPGKHHIEFTATLPVAGRWQRLDLQFPPSMATALTLQLREGDGWLWAEGLPARAGDGRGSFAVPVGAGGVVSLERAAGAQSLGEGPVPTAEALTNVLLREWENVAVQGRVKFSFPGASRQTLTLATDRDLRLGDVVINADVIGTQRTIPIARVESQLRGDRMERVFHLAAAITDEAVLEFEAETTSSDHAPQIIPGARRSKEVVAIFHDESREIKVDPAAAERLGRDEPARDGLKFAGAFQSRSAAPVAYQATLAPEFAEAEVNYVFQLSGQKCEMVAALSMGRSRGTWTHAEMGLPTGYEVQSISGPAVQGWAVEKGRLHLRLDPTQAGRDARVVVHLAIGTEAPVTTWRLEPLKLEGFRDVRGRAVIAVHAATQVRLGDLSSQREVEELDATLPDPVIEGLFNIALPFEKKRALRFGHADWTTQVTMTQEVARYAVDTVALVRASDEGIRLSQQIAIGVEQGSLRSVAVRLPAALPEAVVTGPQLREISTRVEGDERVYDCAFQSDVLGHETLTFDHDLPLAAEVTLPFVKVAGAARLQRFFVLDNRSSRESRVVDSTGLSTAARETVPYLPGDLARPQFFRALGDGQLRIAYEELSMTEANAATVSLAALTTMLRNDGSRWEVVEYSLINRSLQFLAVVLPAQAELISTSVSGTPVRADERLTEGKKVRLVPLIHTQVGQRALEVRLVYRFPKSGGGDWKNLRLDDPELQGLSVERTTWTVWSPKDRTVAKPGGNMDVVTASDLVNEGKLAALSVIADINQQVAAGKLDDDQAAVALEGAEQWLGELSKSGEGEQSYVRADEPLSKQKVAEEWGRQQQMLTENRMSRVQVAGKKKEDAATATAGKDKNQTSWATNGALNKAGDGQLVLTGANTFTGDTSAVAFNDNVGVSQGFFNNGRQQSDQSAAIIAGTWAVTASNARGNNMALQERGRQVTVRAGTLLQNSAAASTVAGTSGSAASMNANGVVAMNGGVVQLQQGTGGVGGVNTYTGATTLNAGTLMNSTGFDLAGTAVATTGSGVVLDGGQLSATGQSIDVGRFASSRASTMSGTITTPPADPFASGPATVPLTRPEADALSAIPKALGAPAGGAFANLDAATPAPAPAMAADPSGGRPTTPAKPANLADIADREIGQRMMSAPKSAAPVIPALQTAALRPTGRHALPVELPVDGVALHFVKLKDNAVVELQLSTPWPAEKLASLIGLASGLLVCGLMAWVGRRWRL
jgi:autotransporter-associated beta strand protein